MNRIDAVSDACEALLIAWSAVSIANGDVLPGFGIGVTGLSEARAAEMYEWFRETMPDPCNYTVARTAGGISLVWQG